MTTILKYINRIRAKHIFGLILIALAIAIILRPYGTVVVIANRSGLTPLIFASILAMCGTVLIIFKLPLLIRWLVTAPFVIYLIGTIELTHMSPVRPFTAITLYIGLYVMTLYFMLRED